MAVESRFVVIRQGVEVQTFMDKKSADEYDKMLDIADSLSEMFENSPLALDEQQTEDLSIYLAQHKDDLLVALQVKKAKPVAKAKKAPAPVLDATKLAEAENVSAAEKEILAAPVDEGKIVEAEKPATKPRARKKAEA